MVSILTFIGNVFLCIILSKVHYRRFNNNKAFFNIHDRNVLLRKRYHLQPPALFELEFENVSGSEIINSGNRSRLLTGNLFSYRQTNQIGMVILVFFRFGQSALADVEFRSDKRFGKVAVVYAFNLYPQQFLGMSGYFDGKTLSPALFSTGPYLSRSRSTSVKLLTLTSPLIPWTPTTAPKQIRSDFSISFSGLKKLFS